MFNISHEDISMLNRPIGDSSQVVTDTSPGGALLW